MELTAKLTGNRRDVNTNSPKALLTHIQGLTEEFRDHCWVKITKDIEKLQPLGHQKPVSVKIEAKIKKYVKRGKEVQETLDVLKICRL